MYRSPRKPTLIAKHIPPGYPPLVISNNVFLSGDLPLSWPCWFQNVPPPLVSSGAGRTSASGIPALRDVASEEIWGFSQVLDEGAEANVLHCFVALVISARPPAYTAMMSTFPWGTRRNMHGSRIGLRSLESFRLELGPELLRPHQTGVDEVVDCLIQQTDLLTWSRVPHSPCPSSAETSTP